MQGTGVINGDTGSEGENGYERLPSEEESTSRSGHNNHSCAIVICSLGAVGVIAGITTALDYCKDKGGCHTLDALRANSTDPNYDPAISMEKAVGFIRSTDSSNTSQVNLTDIPQDSNSASDKCYSFFFGAALQLPAILAEQYMQNRAYDPKWVDGARIGINALSYGAAVCSGLEHPATLVEKVGIDMISTAAKYASGSSVARLGAAVVSNVLTLGLSTSNGLNSAFTLFGSTAADACSYLCSSSNQVPAVESDPESLEKHGVTAPVLG